MHLIYFSFKKPFFCFVLLIGSTILFAQENSSDEKTVMVIDTTTPVSRLSRVIDSVSQEEMLIGPISYQELSAHTAFTWVNDSFKSKLNPILLAQKLDHSLRFLVFIGTWCSDSRNIIPEFIQFANEISFPQENIQFYGVDRNKNGTDETSNIYQITNVPTIIGLKDGKEIFKIIENGKTGNWQDELVSQLN